MPDVPMPDLPLPGQLIAGKYRIEGLLGRGGMGVVMSAHHLALNQRVALKFLSNASPDERSLQRFLREARATFQLESQHVARILDAATLESGVPFIVMEHLRGSNLKQVLTARGPLSVREVVGYLIQACDALAEAHALGIVHRDLKPSNLFLSDRVDGVAVLKVLDFGISKMRASEGFSAAETTSTEAILGSPQYMAPEQIRCAKDADARADVWSLGAVAYELLTGTPAYVAETLPGLLASIVADPAPCVSERRSDTPPGLERVLQRCLEKNPERRFASVGALSRALLPFGAAESAALVQRIERILGEAGSTKSLRAGAAGRADSATLAPAARANGQRRRRLALLAGLTLLGLAGSWRLLHAPAATSAAALAPRAAAQAPLPSTASSPSSGSAAPIGAHANAPPPSNGSLPGPQHSERVPAPKRLHAAEPSAARENASSGSGPRATAASRVSLPQAKRAASSLPLEGSVLPADATRLAASAPSSATLVGTALAPAVVSIEPESSERPALVTPRLDAPPLAPRPPARPTHPLDVFSDPR